MLANDASQPAQQCDFEPARSLSWTHPHRNQASTVIRVSYDSLRSSLNPIPLFFFLSYSLFLFLPPLSFSIYVHMYIYAAIHFAFLSRSYFIVYSIWNRGRIRNREFYSQCEIRFMVGSVQRALAAAYLRSRIYDRVATTRNTTENLYL